MDHSDDFLMHYGVIGMKWGVRKDRSSKNSGGLGKRAASKVGRVISNRRAKRKLAKDLDFDRYRDYKRARNRALKSHDPRVVAANMRTLTDQELSNKIKRLSAEKKVIDLIPPKQKSIGQQVAEKVISTAVPMITKNAVTSLSKSMANNKSGDTEQASASSKSSGNSRNKVKHFLDNSKNVKSSSVSKSTANKGAAQVRLLSQQTIITDPSRMLPSSERDKK